MSLWVLLAVSVCLLPVDAHHHAPDADWTCETFAAPSPMSFAGQAECVAASGRYAQGLAVLRMGAVDEQPYKALGLCQRQASGMVV